MVFYGDTFVILKYGNYAHDDAECAISIAKEALRSDEGDPIGIRETWTIQGRKVAADQATLNTALSALESAYSTNNKNLILYLNNGSASVHQLNVNGSIRGVQVTSGPNYPQGANAQFSTFRDYTITVSADYSSEDDNQNFSYNESFTYQGSGGPRYIVRETLAGAPVTQYLTQSSVRFLVQQGSAQNLMLYPVASPPIQTNQMPERTTVTNTTQSRNGRVVYITRWSYTFSE